LKALAKRINSDLANEIGNLVSRTTKMIDNYFDGAVPERASVESGDAELFRFCRETVELYRKNLDQLLFEKAIANVWELVSAAGRYLVAHEPWVLARSSEKRERLGSVLYNTAEAIRVIALLLSPILPEGAGRILRQLGWQSRTDQMDLESLQWGGLLSGGHVEAGDPVYPRLDVKRLFQPEKPGKRRRAGDDRGSGQESQQQISLEDFAKVDMRVGRVLSASRIPKSSKLVKLMVDLGFEKRQVVAGIGEAYDPKTLPGKLVAVVANLKPVKLMGVESNGMIIAASEKGKPVLATFAEDVALGSRLR
jgi:methionyl-tRNA synthetase